MDKTDNQTRPNWNGAATNERERVGIKTARNTLLREVTETNETPGRITYLGFFAVMLRNIPKRFFRDNSYRNSYLTNRQTICQVGAERGGS